MGVIARGSEFSGEFIPCPAGPQGLVLADVIDLGMVETTWQGQTKIAHKLDFVFLSSRLMDGGAPYQVRQRFTCSLHPKASLRKMLEGWLPDDDWEQHAADGLDLDTLIGKVGLGNIVHRKSAKGTVFANLGSMMPLPEGFKAPTIPDTFTRKPPKGASPIADDPTAPYRDQEWEPTPEPPDDDSIPF